MFPYYLKSLSGLSLRERIAHYVTLAVKEPTERGIVGVSRNMIARRYALDNNDYAAANSLYANPH